jgi:hypothetical protein
MPTSNDVITKQDIQRFTCKTCQNNFIDKNELKHHKKRKHPMLCVNTCKTHAKEAATNENDVVSEMPNVANATLGVATSISPL